jgi:15-cis-phytoene desaturase
METQATNLSGTGASGRPKAVIAGSGLAGLACAKRLVDSGYQVELVEAEAQFGGRTASWTDEKDGEKIESGVHTFFGIYSRLIQLLNEVGVDDDRMVTWDDRVGFLQEGPQLSIFGTDPIRDLPEVLAGLLGNNELLGPLDKLRAGLTFVNGLLQRDQYERASIADLARNSGLNTETYEKLFRPICRGLHFLEPEELSAYALITLLSHGITNPFNIRAGTFRGGMTEVMINPIVRWLQSRGAVLRTNAAVTGINYENESITGFTLKNGEVLKGDVYVSAMPLEVFKELIPQPLLEMPYFSRIKRIETVPATAVQLWFDRNFVSRKEFIYLAGSPFVVFQDESHITFPRVGSRISGQITARYTDSYSDEQYVELMVKELNRYIPASRNATLQKAVVVRHQAFAAKPGVQTLRPEQISPIPNFFLAGDYTRQDWFTTMEGATRSGEMAAAGITRGMRQGRAWEVSSRWAA